jgi:hypothetical protein
MDFAQSHLSPSLGIVLPVLLLSIIGFAGLLPAYDMLLQKGMRSDAADNAGSNSFLPTRPLLIAALR